MWLKFHAALKSGTTSNGVGLPHLGPIVLSLLDKLLLWILRHIKVPKVPAPNPPGDPDPDPVTVTEAECY